MRRRLTRARPQLGALAPRAVLAALAGREAGAADRVVPPNGPTARLVTLSAAAMAFLAVFALALALATGRMAERWSEGLARTMTVRIAAPESSAETQAAAVLKVLQTSPGVTDARVIPAAEMQELLKPWFGADMPVDALPIPVLVEMTAADSLDSAALGLRLKAEAPDAVLDDHTAWRRPLVSAANRLRLMGLLSLALIAGTAAAMISLAARAALAANGQVVRVLRLIGARDVTIATAFMRRFTRRAAIGASAGTLLGIAAVALLPDMSASGGLLTGLGFAGWSWLWALLIPLAAAAVAYGATRHAAMASLREAA